MARVVPADNFLLDLAASLNKETVKSATERARINKQIGDDEVATARRRAESSTKADEAAIRVANAAAKAEAQRQTKIGGIVGGAAGPARALARPDATAAQEARAERELATAKAQLVNLGESEINAENRLHVVRQTALRDYGFIDEVDRKRRVSDAAQIQAYNDVEVATRKVHAEEIRLENDRARAVRTSGTRRFLQPLPRAAVSEETRALADVKPIGADIESAGTGGARSFGESLQALQQHFKDLDTSTSGFTTHIKSAFGFAAIGLIQPLAALLVGLAGTFGAVASAALAAGTAIGAGFVSAIAEGIPVLGLFGAAMQRLQGVMGYVQTLMGQQEQKFIAQYVAAAQTKLGINQVAIAQHNYSDALYATQQASKNVTAAELGLSDALFSQKTAVHNVSVAQLGLDSARQQATRQLQDLIFQETNARLAAEASTLAVTNSGKALRQAIATGGDVQGAQLQLDSARANHAQTVAQAQRAISDAAPASVTRRQIAETVTAASRGVEEARRAVVDANQAVAQAEQGYVSAKRAVVDARFQAAQAKAAITLAQQAAVGFNLGTAAQLAYLRSQMSATEFALTKSITKILDLFKGAHAYTRPLTDAILAPFLGLTNKIYSTLKDKKVFGALQDLANAIGTNFKRVVDAIFTPQSIKAFTGIIEDAAKNIGPLATIAIGLFKGLQGVVTAAAGPLTGFLTSLGTVATNFGKWANSTKGQKWLAKFFTEGFDALKGFLDLGGALIRLFLTIAGPGGGAKKGTDLIEGLAKVLNHLTDDLNNEHSNAFKNLQKIWGAIAPTLSFLGQVFGSIFTALFKLGTSKSGQKTLKDIGDLIATVLVPAFVKFAQYIGIAVGAITNFLKKHPELKPMLIDLIAGGAAMAVAFKGIGLLFGPLSGLLDMVGKLHKAFKFLKDLEIAKIFSGAVSGVKSFAGGVGNVLGKLVPGKVKRLIPGRGGAAAAEGVAGDAAGAAGGAEVAGEAGAAVAGAGEAVGGIASIAGAATGIGLVVGAIIALAKWTGTLGDLWKAIKAPFIAIWTAIKQPIQDFMKQFSYMLDGFKNLFGLISRGVGVFGPLKTIIGDVLRIAFKALGDILGGAGKIIGDTFGNIIKIFSGIFEIIGGLLHGDPGKMLDGAKKIGKALLGLVTDPIKDLGGTLWNLIKDAVHGLLKLGGDLLSIGGKLGGKILDGITGVLSSVGSTLLGLITGAVNDAIIAPINWMIDRINGLPHITLPFGLGKIGIPHIDHVGKLGTGGGGKKTAQATASNLQAAGFAEGGPIPGFGGGDIFPARLEPGEHVFSKEEVQAAGGHGAIFALRQALGGGRQGGPFGYQSGGAATPNLPSLRQTGSTAHDVQGQLQSLLHTITQFSSVFQDTWTNLWKSINDLTTTGISDEESYFKDFFQKIENQWQGLNDNLTSTLNDWWKTTNQTVQDQLNKLLFNFKYTYTNVDTDTFNAFWYILHTAQQSLDAFGQKFTPPSLAKQPAMQAIGGFVGNAGERGRDAVHTVLGRGEAVLNYAHQAVVEPALNAYYGFGLNRMFQRTGGLHAGARAYGMAAGGYPPTGNVVVEPGKNMTYGQEPQILTDLRSLANELRKTVYVISGYRTPQHSVAVGGFANDPHTRGEAADIGIGGPSLDSMFGIKEAQLRAVGLYRPFYPASAHEVNHVQLLSGGPSGVGEAGFTGAVGAATATGAVAAWQNIARRAVRGTGALAKLMRASIGKVTDAANQYGMQQAGAGMDIGSIGVPGNVTGSVAHQIAHALAALGWNKIAIAGAIGNASQESSLVPSISGGGAAGLWQWTPGSKLFDYAAAVKKPWQAVATQAALMTQTIGRSGVAAMNSAGSPANAASWLMTNFERPLASAANLPNRIAQAIRAYAAGLAGGGFAGGAVPILAHAGEWVVNQAQQSKLAGWLGTSRQGLKGAMGFTGGPQSFAGGGEVVPLQPTISKTGALKDPALVEASMGLDFVTRSVAIVLQGEGILTRAIARLRKQGDKTNKSLKTYLDNMDQLLGDGGILTLAAQALDTFVSRQQTFVSLAANGIRRVVETTRVGSRVIRTVTERLHKVRPETALQVATDDLSRAQTIGDDLDRLQRREVSALASVGNQLAHFGKVTKDNLRQYRRLIGQRKSLTDQIADTDSKIASNAQDIISKQQTQFQASLDQTLRGPGTISGGDFRKAIGGGLGNLRDIIGKVGPAIALGIAQTAQTLAQTLGDPKKLATADTAIIESSKRQRDALQQAYNTAAAKAQKDPRWQKTADDLLGQLQSSITSLAQAQVQGVTDAISAADTVASHQAAARSLQGRVATVATALGRPLEGIQRQIATSQGTASDLTGQIATQQGLLDQATALGMTNTMADLTDKINDLKEQVVESNLLTQQLVTSERQLAVTLLTTQSQATTGFFGAANSIAQTLGAIAGNQNLPTLIKYAHDASAAIMQEGQKALSNIHDALTQDPQTGDFAFGANQGAAAGFLQQLTDAFQKGPQIFADTLANLAPSLATFEAGLPPDQQALFQQLVQSLIDNTTAQVGNTQTLQQLNASSNQQAFASAPWRMFRDAIFNGLGGLLPQYAMEVPSLQMGGTLTRAGLVYGHEGEALVPAGVSHGVSGLGNTNHTNHFNITNPTEVADPVILGNAIAWRLSHDPNSR